MVPLSHWFPCKEKVYSRERFLALPGYILLGRDRKDQILAMVEE